MMVALDRGGAAGKVEDFCCVCDRSNKTRGNIIFQKDGETREFGHSAEDYISLKEAWAENPNLLFFQPEKSNTEFTDRVGVIFSNK